MVRQQVACTVLAVLINLACLESAADSSKISGHWSNDFVFFAFPAPGFGVLRNAGQSSVSQYQTLSDHGLVQLIHVLRHGGCPFS
jgi:hypothetical protein